jgi:hypothetical protein
MDLRMRRDAGRRKCESYLLRSAVGALSPFVRMEGHRAVLVTAVEVRGRDRQSPKVVWK